MTALALAMQDASWSVSGSDTNETFITDDILNVRNLGVRPLGSDVQRGRTSLYILPPMHRLSL